MTRVREDDGTETERRINARMAEVVECIGQHMTKRIETKIGVPFPTTMMIMTMVMVLIAINIKTTRFTRFAIVLINSPDPSFRIYLSRYDI